MSIKSKVIAAASGPDHDRGPRHSRASSEQGPQARPRRAAGARAPTFSPSSSGPTSPNSPSTCSSKARTPASRSSCSAANADPALDWDASFQGQVGDFYAAGLVSSSVALHYGCNGSVTVQRRSSLRHRRVPWTIWRSSSSTAPSASTGPVRGRGQHRVQGEGVTLQPCGVSRTRVDRGHPGLVPEHPAYSDEIPLINGSSTNFSHPFVLTYPADGFPTDKPRPQLRSTT